MTLHLSRKQAHANVEFECRFLGMLTKLATKAILTLLGELAMGLIGGGVEKAASRNGLFLGKHGYGTARIDFPEGNGMILTQVEDKNFDSDYMKYRGQIFQGKGLLLGKNSPFETFPFLD